MARRPAAGTLRFAFVGTIRPHKGAHVLVEAFARAGLDEAELVLYGDPDADPAYTARLRSLAGSSAVRFAGQLPNADVPAAIRLAVRRSEGRNGDAGVDFTVGREDRDPRLVPDG